jgi:hypothetical protein
VEDEGGEDNVFSDGLFFVAEATRPPHAQPQGGSRPRSQLHGSVPIGARPAGGVGPLDVRGCLKSLLDPVFREVFLFLS